MKIACLSAGSETWLTGTKNKTPVTIDVNAVPRTTREYMFPSDPMTKAPDAATISVLPGRTVLVARFAAYAQQEKITITKSCH